MTTTTNKELQEAVEQLEQFADGKERQSVGLYAEAIEIANGKDESIQWHPEARVLKERSKEAAGLTSAINIVLAALSQPPVQEEGKATFQARVQPWMMACFGAEISADRLERGDRLLEETLELLQSGAYPPDRVLALRDYVWSRPVGEPAQEVGGVMVTLAAYCLAHGLDMHDAGETELARIWTKVEKIRAKQEAKPTGSALPIAHPVQPDERRVRVIKALDLMTEPGTRTLDDIADAVMAVVGISAPVQPDERVGRLVEALKKISDLSWRDENPTLEASYAQSAIVVAQRISAAALAAFSSPEGGKLTFKQPETRDQGRGMGDWSAEDIELVRDAIEDSRPWGSTRSYEATEDLIQDRVTDPAQKRAYQHRNQQVERILKSLPAAPGLSGEEG